MKRSRFLLHTVACVAGILASGQCRAAEPAVAGGSVSLWEDDGFFILANGIVTARIEKRSGNVVSIKYGGLELIGRGYWSFVGRSSRPGTRTASAVRTDPAANGGARAEVSCKLSYDGKPGSLPVEMDLRYALGRDESGLFAYALWTHRLGDPGFSVGEARYAVKLNPKVFDFLTVDARRRQAMPSGDDWDQGMPLELKEVRQITTGPLAGRIEHKYDYSALLSETPAYGWSSSEHKVGLWVVNPSMEYLSGGPTKVELTGHLDVNPGGAPTLLNMWVGSHYGGASLVVTQEEAWAKCIGPFLLYCNSAPDHEALWKDALVRAAQEAAAWPYGWVADPAYPRAGERATVNGHLAFHDPLEPAAKVTNLQVGLTSPDYAARGRGAERTIDWQRDAKFYQFWTKADAAGRFTIPKVRAGAYTLRAIADGVPGEFAKANVTVGVGETLDLGALKWTAERTGRTLWQIGIADRTAAEFRHGDHYWHWGLPAKYAEEFPNDVRFVIGSSDPHRDWNYCQPPRRLGGGRVESTTWTIEFDLPQLLSGRATLRFGIAGSRAPQGIQVSVNGAPAGETGPLPDTAVIHRDGIRGAWCERRVAFDAALLRSGMNTIGLRVAAQSWVEGVLYDFVRLEVAETTAPPGSFSFP